MVSISTIFWPLIGAGGVGNTKNEGAGTSLVVQWLRIRLSMQGIQVRTLVREDPTWRGATKPVRHNYWACALEPTSHNYWAHTPQLLKPTPLEPVLCNKRSQAMRSPRTATKSSPRSPQLEKAHMRQQRPNVDKKEKSMKGQVNRHLRITTGQFTGTSLSTLPGELRRVQHPRLPCGPEWRGLGVILM